jgi:hypothetical protein
MGLFNSLCKNCDDEIDWFLEAKKGIKCLKCKTVNTQEDLWKNLCGIDYHGNKELYIKKRKVIRERKFKIEKIKKSM